MLISTSPGFERFTSALLSSNNAENIVLHNDGEPDETVRAIVRQKTHKTEITSRGGYQMTSDFHVLKISPTDAAKIIIGSTTITVRGLTYHIAKDPGLIPDGVALVALYLETTPR